jgi:hypothetical protein
LSGRTPEFRAKYKINDAGIEMRMNCKSINFILIGISIYKILMG